MIGVLKRLRAGQPSVYWFDIQQVYRIFLFSKSPDCGSYRALSSVGTEEDFLRLSRPGHDSDHAPQFSEEFKNEWSCNTTPSICLHSLHRDKYTLILRFLRIILCNNRFHFFNSIYNVRHFLMSTPKCLTLYADDGAGFHLDHVEVVHYTSGF